MKKTFSFILIVWTINNACSQSKKIYLNKIAGEEESSESRYFATKIFKNKLEEGSLNEVFIPEKSENTSNLSIGEISQKAKNLQCSQFIISELNKLNNYYFLNISAYETDKMQKIISINYKFEKLENIDSVFTAFDKRLNPKKAEKIALEDDKNAFLLPTFTKKDYFRLSLGGYVPFYPNNSGIVPGFGIGGLLDYRKLILELGVDAYISAGNTSLLFAKTDFLLPLSNQSNTMYLSAGLNLGAHFLSRNITQGGTVSNGGFILHGGFGFLFNRGTVLPIRGDIKMLIPTYQLERQVPLGALVGFSIYL